jgi:hypothetical protein
LNAVVYLRASLVISRPDGGHSELLVTRPGTEPAPDRTVLRALEARVSRHGLDGHVRIDVNGRGDALTKALLTGEPSLAIVDNPTFDAAPGSVPVLVVHGEKAGPDAVRLIVDGDKARASGRRVCPKARARRVSRPRRLRRRSTSMEGRT